MLLMAIMLMAVLAGGAGGATGGDDYSPINDSLEMWIDERQVNAMYGGMFGRWYVISEASVEEQIKDPHLERYLPVIPTQISRVNFSWRAGTMDKYTYNIHTLQSFNTNILHEPSISIDRKGEIPREEKSFSVFISCVRNASGIANFRIGFEITDSKGKTIPGMPLKLDLRKECRETNTTRALCYPDCMNNGTCVDPGVCQCKDGFIGSACEGGMCTVKCAHGGKCIQKDNCSCINGYIGDYCLQSICRRDCQNGGTCLANATCLCTSGFYGEACELTKCLVQCINGGVCIGDDECHCKNKFFTGKHCEKPRCKPSCSVHGVCIKGNQCKCDPGWTGRKCRRKKVSAKNNHNGRTKKKNDI